MDFVKFCQDLVNDPAFQNEVKIKFLEGKLDPKMRDFIMQVGAGKTSGSTPKDMNVRFPDGIPGETTDYRRMSVEQLRRRLAELTVALGNGDSAGAES